MAGRLHGKVIGLIGDEHLVGPFGRVLVPLLKQAGALVVEDGRAGRKASHLLAPALESEAAAASGLKRAGPIVLTTVLGAKLDALIFVLKAEPELDKLKVMAHAAGVKEVWVAQPTGSMPEQDATHVYTKLTGEPPPQTLPVTIRRVRERI